MRITGGFHRGRPLQVPKGRDVRPTSDKVRQAIFNILQKYDLPDGAVVLDVFCGTGVLGLEALSRGARQCVFVDNSHAALAVCRQNVETLGLADKTAILSRDLRKPGTRKAEDVPATLLFMDPPYRQDMIENSLKLLIEKNWITHGTLCVIESEGDLDITLPDDVTLLDRRLYGDTRISFCRSG